MREIKFRAWDKNRKRMYVGDELNAIYQTGILMICADNNDWMVMPPDYELMQYTGLKDKNGVEIYRCDRFGGFWDHSYVDYCDKCVSMQLFFEEEGCAQCLGDVSWREFIEEPSRIEVIGSIYESPAALD